MCRTLVTLALVSMMSIGTSSLARAQGDMIDVIVMTTGSVDTLAEEIESLGGVVTLTYENVPALAATIPIIELDAVAAIDGTTLVKDEIIELDTQLDHGKNGMQTRMFEASLEGGTVAATDLEVLTADDAPTGYANYLYTGAIATWDAANYGEGSIVAVVDTGIVPNFCIQDAIIGEGYNATGDGFSATDPGNHYHGTAVGGVIASNCIIGLAPGGVVATAVETYLGWPHDFVPIVGQAPGAKLYPVKVFKQNGAGSATSVILDGLDHVLTLKKTGALDIDIVNMSLGGPTLYAGHDVYDRFLQEMFAAKILVVASAGNEGPRPNTVGSPATSRFSVSVGALDYGPSSAAFYEYLGLKYGMGQGQGAVMRSTLETRAAVFSSRGPTCDGRSGPDLSAQGMWNFVMSPTGGLMWVSGTSFSGPTVAGVAALLNAYQEGTGSETVPSKIRDALYAGADPHAVGTAWQDPVVIGRGAVDAFTSMHLLMTGDAAADAHIEVGKPKANVLRRPKPGTTNQWTSPSVTLGPSETYDAVFEVSEHTSRLIIQVYDIETPDNYDWAFWANSLEVHVQSAKRSGFEDQFHAYWDPNYYGGSFTIVVEDGPWTLYPFGMNLADQPMEPGLFKITLNGDYSNEAPVSFQMSITRENYRTPPTRELLSARIEENDLFWYQVYMPAGFSKATFDLSWKRMWNDFPTSDIDLYIFDSEGGFHGGGATYNAPERATLMNPPEGLYDIAIAGFELYMADRFKLFVDVE